MIDRESWFSFIRGFFGVAATDEWLNHVIRNWNFISNNTGCGCSWNFENLPRYNFCAEYLDMQNSRVKEETDDSTY